MTEVIKYNAWAPQNKVMLYDVGFNPDPVVSRLINKGTMAGKLNEYILLQYTGLNDKFGVEIYDGHILQEEAPRGNRYKVFRVPGGFGINAHQNDLSKDKILFYEALADMQTASYITSSCKVIGTIYQNPNFLIK